MEAVSELEAECVLTGLEFKGGGGLALSVVEVLFVSGDDLADGSEISIDKDMEVSCSFVDFAGEFDGESGRRHYDFEGRGDGCAVGRLLKSHRGGFVSCHDDDGDGVGVLVAFEGGVEAVSELEAECMLSGLEFERNCSLALAVVEVNFIGRDDLPGGNKISIDEDVKVPCVFVDLTGRFNDEAGCRHQDFKG